MSIVKIKLAILSLLLSAGVLTLSAQLANDQALIHMDKPYYVSGETAWYQIYLPEVFRSVSGNVQVLIQDQTGAIVDDYFWSLDEAKIEGYYKIPYNIKADLYHFSLRTLDNTSKEPITITTWSVPIYSDLNAQGMQAIFPERTTFAAERSTLDVNLTPASTSYVRGEEVSVNVSTPAGTKTDIMSVSVVDLSLIGPSAESTVFVSAINIPDNVTLGINDQTFVHGIIRNAANDREVAIGVIGAYHAKYNRMYYTKSKENGKFTLMLKDHTGDGELQFAGNLYDLYKSTDISLEVPAVTNSYTLTSDYDTGVIEYLKESNARKRIYQFYKQLESPVTYNEVKPLDRLFVKPNKAVNVKEYVTFENTGIFFNEVMGFQIDFKKKGDDDITARIFDPETTKGGRVYSDNFFPRSPVFIVDGKLTKDAAFVYNLKLTDLEDVSIYNDWRDITKQYGTFGDFGYVVINTSQADLSVPEDDENDIVAYSGKAKQVQYPINLSSAEGEAPNLTPTVYWNPNEATGKLKFKSSDDVGEFLVRVVVRDKTGKIGVASTTYKSQRRAN